MLCTTGRIRELEDENFFLTDEYEILKRPSP
jgi:hypothetical protein